MSDLISRRQIHDYIQSQINPYGKPFEGTAYEFGLKIMDYIKNMSTVKPVRGEWVPEEKIYRSPLALNYRCSQCGETSRKTNFCPNCGCDMRGEKND